MNTQHLWTNLFPTSTGTYWFHGWLTPAHEYGEAETYLVTVIISGGEICAATSDRWVHKSKARGVWTPVTVPVPSSEVFNSLLE
jgi:hypothetical protein